MQSIIYPSKHGIAEMIEKHMNVPLPSPSLPFKINLRERYYELKWIRL